jgi:hypothetical protein
MLMNRSFQAVAAALVVVAGLILSSPMRAGVASAVAAQADTFNWQGTLAAGQTIEIKGVNGSVRATAASGGGVEVTAAKSARRSDPASVGVVVVEHAGGVTICALYPDAGRRSNECVPGAGGRMNVRRNDVRVDFTVRVPAGVHFVGRTVNGDVEAEGLGGNAEAFTVNGDARLAAAGYGGARTVNGSIHAALGRSDWSEPLEFQTVNGGITVMLPSDVSTEVQADSVNGGFTTEFPTTVAGRLSRRHFSGTIGDGGRRLLLRTVNGSIELQRAP